MKKLLMYGAGNIGRGFIGQLFSQSGYEVVYIDINDELIAAFNREHRYPVRILSGKETRDIWVENASGIHGADVRSITEAISIADIMATAVGAGALPTIAKQIAAGLNKRWQIKNMKAFDILVCENLPEAGSTFAGFIRAELGQEHQEFFDEKVGIVETSIGRMVPVMTPERMDGNPLRVCVEEFCELPVDQNGFKGAIPPVINMIPYSPFAYIHQRKLYIHNMGHALTAYLGRLKGYLYIAGAIEDPVIRQVVTAAMRDLAECLCKRHGTSREDTNSYVDDLIRRFGNRQLCDTVDRVGNDAKRKLSPRDRLVGAARLCVEYGISPQYLCLGIAAAIRFLCSENKTGDCPVSEVLEKICGIDSNDPLYESIIVQYKAIESGIPLEDTVKTITEILNQDAASDGEGI